MIAIFENAEGVYFKQIHREGPFPCLVSSSAGQRQLPKWSRNPNIPVY